MKEKTTTVKFTKFGMIRFFLKGSLSIFVIGILANIVMSLLNLLYPQIISFAIDSVIGDKQTTYPAFVQNIIDLFGGVEGIRANIWLLAVAMVILALFIVTFRYIFTYSNNYGSAKMLYRMRGTLFTHIQRLPLSWHLQHQTGDIIQRCTSDLDTISTFVSGQLVQLFRLVIMIGTSLFVMFTMNTMMSIIVCCFIPVIVAYSVFFHGKISKSFKVCDEQEGVLSTMEQENFTGVRVVRAFGREAYERDRFEKQNVYYSNLWIKLGRWMSFFWNSSWFISALQKLVIVTVGTVLCVNGSLTAGEFVAFIFYNTMLSGPIRQLGRMISEMSKAGVSIDRIAEIMNADEEDYADDESVISGDICFDKVTFEYEQGKPVLSDVSFTIPQGTTLGIIGGTGSGKSTLIALLARLYDTNQGAIYINGTNIKDIPLTTLRRNLGVVLQEGFLYSKTVGQNISFASDSDDMAKIEEAAKSACVDDNIKSFVNGYDTIVGERGVTLSGGQKQRVSIARTLMRHSPILIFDDSLSAVDSVTDAKIRANLKKHFDGATVIIISHRITTIMHADNIIVLEGGKIIESGTNEQLLQQDGEYKKIYDLQMSLPDDLKGEVI